MQKTSTFWNKLPVAITIIVTIATLIYSEATNKANIFNKINENNIATTIKIDNSNKLIQDHAARLDKLESNSERLARMEQKLTDMKEVLQDIEQRISVNKYDK